jgi:hypothetical protein
MDAAGCITRHAPDLGSIVTTPPRLAPRDGVAASCTVMLSVLAGKHEKAQPPWANFFR